MSMVFTSIYSSTQFIYVEYSLTFFFSSRVPKVKQHTSRSIEVIFLESKKPSLSNLIYMLFEVKTFTAYDMKEL